MGPHCTVRPRVLTMAFAAALTLNLLKVTMYNIYNAAGLTQSPSEAVPLNVLWEGPGVLLMDRQSVALWKMYETVFAFSMVHCVMELPLQTLLVFQTVS